MLTNALSGKVWRETGTGSIVFDLRWKEEGEPLIDFYDHESSIIGERRALREPIHFAEYCVRQSVATIRGASRPGF